MPIIKSAKKRVRTAEKAAIRNSKVKRTLKTAVKAFRAAVTGGEKTTETHAKAQSAIDTAAKKGLIHKNKAARQKAQLAKSAKAAAGDDKPATAKKATKTTAAKKATAAKVAPAKAKAAATKKTAAKKPAAKK
ncbi:MAG TPA: 30S ribosomal protein S20 [Candidatus Saccharimonadales bacterium]|nr:30S ribosomal protein S20 [Candidatus Saccharimonadales bacterium]